MKVKYIIVLVSVILCITLVYVIKGNKPTEKELVSRELEQKYNENFQDINFVKTVKHDDYDFGLDGTFFFTKKGQGEVHFYTAYSEVNDLEFGVLYDTYSEQYEDSYSHSLNLRKNILLLYNQLQTAFDVVTNKVAFSPNTHDENSSTIEISNQIELENLLSKVIDGYTETHTGVTYTRLSHYIDENGLKFCKEEYSELVKKNDYIIKLHEENPLLSLIDYSIYTSDRIGIYFGNPDVLIYDKFETGKAWGETLEDFIKRDSY